MEGNIKQKKECNERKKKRNKYIQKKILQVFIIIFSFKLLIISLITIASTVKAHDLAFGRYRFYIMRTASRPYAAEKGDLVIAEKLDDGNYKIGDYIVYGDNKTYYCDEIAEVKKVNIVNKVITAESDGISYRFNENEISGRVIRNIHKLGNIITFLRTPVGIVLFILFTICLFALLRILICSKDDDDEDEEGSNQAQHINIDNKSNTKIQ